MDQEPVIYWSRGNIAEKVSHVEGVDEKKRETESRRKKVKSPKPKKSSKSIQEAKPKLPLENHTTNTTQNTNSSLKSSKSQNVSLKNLCFEDKQRVANLIRELAKANEDKTESEITLNNERKKFKNQLISLKEDKLKIEEEQKRLLKQYCESQKLLTHYQNQITEQQKEVAKDITKLLNATPLHKHTTDSDSDLKSPLLRNLDNQDITVHELNDSKTNTQRSYSGRSNSKNEPFLLGESYLSEITFSGNENKRQRGLKIEVPTRDRGEKIQNDHEYISSDHPYNIEEYARSLTSAFENRVKKLSPNSRKAALIDQKRALENEQLHLQKLLQQQEDMLRKRQSELKRRHKIYSEKITTCNRCDKKKDYQNLSTSKNKSDGFNLSTSNSTTNETLTRNSTPLYSRDKEVYLPEYQPRHAVLYEDARNLSRSTKSENTSKSQTSSSIQPLQEETIDRDFNPLSKSYENKPWSIMQSTNHRPPSSSRDHMSRSTTGHVTGDYSSRSYSNNKSVDNSSRSMTSSTIEPEIVTSFQPEIVTSSTVQPTLMRSSTIEPQNMTSFEPKVMTPSTIHPSHTRSSTLDPEILTSFSIDRDDDHVTSMTIDDVRRPLHATMNNISMLSDLVESTDLSNNTDHRRFTQSYSTSFRASDVMGSTTFDPDDSEILKDIFFIR